MACAASVESQIPSRRPHSRIFRASSTLGLSRKKRMERGILCDSVPGTRARPEAGGRKARPYDTGAAGPLLLVEEVGLLDLGLWTLDLGLRRLRRRWRARQGRLRL